MKNSKTRIAILNSILGAILGLIFWKHYPRGIVDPMWWLGIAWSISLVYTYYHMRKKIDDN
jgi:hypothetical protein